MGTNLKPPETTFDINQAFKWIPFVWGDYDGVSFRGLRLPYLWSRFWWTLTIYNILRYLTLAILPSSYHDRLEFYLCKRFSEFIWIQINIDLKRFQWSFLIWAEIFQLLGDFVTAISGKPYLLMILIAPLYNGLFPSRTYKLYHVMR